MRDLHQMVIHHIGKVIGRHAVTLEQDRVEDRAALDLDVTADQIMHTGNPFQGRGKTDNRRAAFGGKSGALGISQPAVAAVVALLQTFGALFIAHGIQLFAGDITAVGMAAGNQLVYIAVIERFAFALHIGAIGATHIGPFIPL